jgi:Putative MetA-pathway of phenol degradation
LGLSEQLQEAGRGAFHSVFVHPAADFCNERNSGPAPPLCETGQKNPLLLESLWRRVTIPDRISAEDLGMPSKSRVLPVPTLLAFACLGISAAAADGCPTSEDEIATDRPDVTNSSLVVPMGSLQSENGINLSGRDGATLLDATNTRLRLGVAHCLEVLVDVPTYFAVLDGEANSGWTNVTPAVKWQISPVPKKIDLSVVVGAGLPTGTLSIAGRGVQPYLQAPWSWEMGAGWSVNGMITAFFFPSDPVSKLTRETTFSIEKEVGEHADLFVEYVGDYPEHGDSQLLLNSGGAYRFTRTQQIDFHVSFGLNNDAPHYIFGLGYSFRFDGLF